MSTPGSVRISEHNTGVTCPSCRKGDIIAEVESESLPQPQGQWTERKFTAKPLRYKCNACLTPNLGIPRGGDIERQVLREAIQKRAKEARVSGHSSRS